MTYRQPFTGDHPITQGYGESVTADFHTGIDYACPMWTEVKASGAGVVRFAGFDKTGYGLCVIIQHDDGNATLYGHLSLICANAGSRVKAGQEIGQSGSTGRSTGPHLHFEARAQWDKPATHFDPLRLPLTSVVDTPEEPAANPLHLVRPGLVRVAAPWGAKMFDDQWGLAGCAAPGRQFEFSGETKQANGYTYARVIPVDAIRWIAIHDNDTQILEEA